MIRNEPAARYAQILAAASSSPPLRYTRADSGGLAVAVWHINIHCGRSVCVLGALGRESVRLGPRPSAVSSEDPTDLGRRIRVLDVGLIAVFVSGWLRSDPVGLEWVQMRRRGHVQEAAVDGLEPAEQDRRAASCLDVGARNVKAPAIGAEVIDDQHLLPLSRTLLFGGSRS